MARPKKLSQEEARKIRRFYFTDGYTQADLADVFGVCRKTVNWILSGKAYPEADLGIKGTAEIQLILTYH